MYILTIHYPRSDGDTFDFNYFKSTHLPALGEGFKPFGLGYASVLRGDEALGGGEPAFFATTILSFSDEEAARNAVNSDVGKQLAKDIANFTSVTPVMQFNTAVR